MRSLSRATLTALAILVASLPVQAQEYERILLPIVSAPTAGAYDSVWQSFFVAYNGGDTPAFVEYPFGCVLGTCPRGNEVQPHSFVDTQFLTPPPAGLPGLFVYAEKPQSASFAFNLRVQDLSRQSLTWGTELPVVRESDARTAVTDLLSIPTDQRFRVIVRIYDFDSRPQSSVHIRVLSMTSSIPLTEFDVLLSRPHDENVSRPFYPGYGSIADIIQRPGVAAQPEVRIEIHPITEGLRYWAFVSVTNNETQHVTTITPE